jgi:tRNA (guanosine-2'-O-)-methyltransferase
MMNERQERMHQIIDRRQPDFTVILENVFDSHNISAVMRTCDAVGIGEIFVLNTMLPPHDKWGFRSSAGTWKWVAVHQFTNLHECMEAVRSRYHKVYATHLQPSAGNLFEMDFTQPIAIVFGNEQKGCTPEMLAAVDGSIYIPQEGMAVSLNISVACAVTLYEAYRQKRIAGHYNGPRLSQEERTRLFETWTDFKEVRRLKGKPL